jgi:hypothetical protein
MLIVSLCLSICGEFRFPSIRIPDSVQKYTVSCRTVPVFYAKVAQTIRAEPSIHSRPVLSTYVHVL